MLMHCRRGNGKRFVMPMYGIFDRAEDAADDVLRILGDYFTESVKCANTFYLGKCSNPAALVEMAIGMQVWAKKLEKYADAMLEADKVAKQAVRDGRPVLKL